MSQSGYSIHILVQEAKARWLKPAEIFFILQNYTEDQITHTLPQKPAAGSLFLFNKRVLRFFRKDGHSWRKKKDGKTVGEAHERLKVGNTEALNCYYAHGEQNPNFQRRSFWMLDPAYDHIVLVHYRDIGEGRTSSGSVSKLSTGSPSTFSQSQSLYSSPDPGSTTVITEYRSPESVEVNSDAVFKVNGIDYTDRMERNDETSSSPELEVSQALRRLEAQLSLNDDRLEESGQFCSPNENTRGSEYSINDQRRSTTSQENVNSLLLQRSDDNRQYDNQGFGQQFTVDPKDSFSWTDMLEVNTSLPTAVSQENDLHSNGNGMLEQEGRRLTDFDGHNGYKYNDFGTANSNSSQATQESNKSLSMMEAPLTSLATSPVPQEVEDFKFPAYFPSTSVQNNHPYYTTLLDQSQNGIHLEAVTSLTIAPEKKFTIREICPEWTFATELTKVVIVGSFHCDPSQGEWACMFGDIEVPVQIIQEGVLCCTTPPHLPGKITLCITSRNRESCSEVREFEYRDKPSNCVQCISSQQEKIKSPDELLLLVRFVQMLLSDAPMNKGVPAEPVQDSLGMPKADDDSWDHVIDALLVGNWNSSSTTDWVMQELLKDKLQHWLLSRSLVGADQPDCSLSKNEQSVIHMIAGLGFVWALSPILNAGVSINFRDINGWTALHWAAQFGREQMVAALIASGASAGAVTDPNTHDLTGRTPASIAAARGHKGLAGYLSEVALTSHLSSLTLEVNEFSKGSADGEAEFAVNSISSRNLTPNEDQLSLKDSLAAARNAVQAAARIQSAFRAHSFRRRNLSEAASDAGIVDEYGIYPNEVQGLSAKSRMAFRPTRDHNKAALSIQKKFRGWKGRKDFLVFRQKVVKIQAHIRGHQVRKQYKVICWAVGVLEKVVLRWRRKGIGLRGYQPDLDLIDQNEDGDILRSFRKKKVDGTIDEAVSQVFSMVDSPKARQQYCRVLERYRQAKAELDAAEASLNEVSYMENEDSYI